MTDALEDHQGTVGIKGRTITNLRFADDIDGLAGKQEGLASLVDRLGKTSAASGMELNKWHQHRHQNQRRNFGRA